MCGVSFTSTRELICNFKNRRWWQPALFVCFKRAEQFELELAAVAGLLFHLACNVMSPILIYVNNQAKSFILWPERHRLYRSELINIGWMETAYPAIWCSPSLFLISSLFVVSCVMLYLPPPFIAGERCLFCDLQGSTRSASCGSDWNDSWNIHHRKLHLS